MTPILNGAASNLTQALIPVVIAFATWALGQVANYFKQKASQVQNGNTIDVLGVVADAARDTVAKFGPTLASQYGKVPNADIALGLLGIAIAEAQAHGSDIIQAAGWSTNDLIASMSKKLETAVAAAQPVPQPVQLTQAAPAA